MGAFTGVGCEPRPASDVSHGRRPVAIGGRGGLADVGESGVPSPNFRPRYNGSYATPRRTTGGARHAMAKHVRCADSGMNCDFEIQSENEDELVDFVQIHSRTAHDQSMSESDVRQMMQET